MTTIRLSDQLNIPLEKAIGRRFAVIGQSGSGKSTTLYTFLSEWAAAGLPFTVNDPWTDFVTLPNALVVGMSDGVHLRLSMANAAALAEMSVRERFSVVIDTRFYDDAEMLDIYQAYLTALWNALRAQQPYQPYALVMDEAQDFIPQNGDTPVKALAIKLAKQGRHVRLTSVMASQRPASVTKDVLTQAEVLIGHSLKYPVETSIVREQLPLPAKDVNAMFRRLHPGEAIVVGARDVVGDGDYLQTQIERHVSMPDKSSGAVIIPASTIDAVAIDRLRHALEGDAPTAIVPVQPDPELVRLRAENQRLQALLDTAQRDLAAERSERVRLEALPRPAPVQMTLAAAGESHEAVTVREKVTTTVTEREMDYHSDKSLKILINRQQSKFQEFLAWARGLTKMERVILYTLLVRDTQSFTEKQLAPLVGYQAESVYRVALKCFERGLITRRGSKRANFIYQANAAHHFGEQFQNLDAAVLLDQFLRVLSA